MKPLTLIHPEATKERLLALAREVPGAWIGLKIAALLLVLEGQRRGWITHVLGLTRMSLTSWVHTVNERGVSALRPNPRPGRPGQLTSFVRQEISNHLQKSPQAFGLPRARWDGPTLAEHVKRHLGIEIKVRQAQYWLHKLGYRMKRASYVYVQARREDAQNFLEGLKKTPES